MADSGRGSACLAGVCLTVQGRKGQGQRACDQLFLLMTTLRCAEHAMLRVLCMLRCAVLRSQQWARTEPFSDLIEPAVRDALQRCVFSAMGPLASCDG